MNTKNNARAQSTRESIEAAALGLLEAQPEQRLTVQAICCAAQINRSTFYRHFPDIPALAERLLSRHLAQMRALISNDSALSPQSFRHTMVQLIRYTQAHRTFFLAYFNGRGVHRPRADAESALFYSAFLAFGENRVRSEAYRFHVLYFSAGFSALIYDWLARGCIEPPEYLADVICRQKGIRLSAPDA